MEHNDHTIEVVRKRKMVIAGGAGAGDEWSNNNKNQPHSEKQEPTMGRAAGASDRRCRSVGDGWGSKGWLANGCRSVRWPEQKH